MAQIRTAIAAASWVLFLPVSGAGQGVFDWPLRATPRPESVLHGAAAVFWNPGGLAAVAGAVPEVWLLHVDGPDATGVRGAALAGVLDVPLGLRIGIGYSHLGIEDIPRTSTSPSPEPGEINVSEDTGTLALAWSLGNRTGLGAAVRVQRGSAAGEARVWTRAEVGVHHRSTLPFSPRFGLALTGLGQEWRTLGGAELRLGALADDRIPIRVGYGFQLDRDFDPLEHRFSLRASWMDQLRFGMGVSYLGAGDGWSPLWMLGAEIGRYSLGVLRESLANDFGPVHFFQGSVRFP